MIGIDEKDSIRSYWQGLFVIEIQVLKGSQDIRVASG